MSPVSPSCAIFWDANGDAIPPIGVSLQEACEALRHYSISSYGRITSFKAYASMLPGNLQDVFRLSSSMQLSGVTLSLHLPSNTQEPDNEVSSPKDHHIITDIMSYALEDPSPTKTAVLISSDYEQYGYMLSTLKNKMCNISVLAPGDLSPKVPNYVHSLDAQWPTPAPRSAPSLSRWDTTENTKASSTPSVPLPTGTSISSTTATIVAAVSPSSPGTTVIPLSPTSHTTTRASDWGYSYFEANSRLHALIRTRDSVTATSIPKLRSFPECLTSPPWRPFALVLPRGRPFIAEMSYASGKATTKLTVPSTPPRNALDGLKNHSSSTSHMSQEGSESARMMELLNRARSNEEQSLHLAESADEPEIFMHRPSPTWRVESTLDATATSSLRGRVGEPSQLRAGALPFSPAVQSNNTRDPLPFVTPSTSIATAPTSLAASSTIPSSSSTPKLPIQISPSITPDSQFEPLKSILIEFHEKGNPRPLRSAVGELLRQRNPDIYTKGNLKKFKDYVALAAKQQIIRLHPGSPGKESISYIPPPQLTEFDPLREILGKRHASGMKPVPYNIVGPDLGLLAKQAYEKAGVKNFRQYLDLAASKGVIVFEGDAATGNLAVALK